MKRAAIILTLASAAWAPRPSGAQELRTRAELTDYRETSSYADVVAFARLVAAADRSIHYTSYGYTSEGRPLPLLVVGDVEDPTPESVRASGKTVVYLQGNIHGGEVCGKEALQMLLRDIAGGDHPEWTASMVLLVAPIYNADGNERVALDNRPRQHGPIGGMGQRPNAQGYDLNRDHMKLDSPEARSVARLLTEYDPHVTLDLHTTNGTRHAYHLTYSPPLHPNTPPAIDALLRERILPHVTDAIRESDGWEFYYYGNAFAPQGTEERGWYTFDHRPRFNNNYIGLRNRVAILSEAYAYATFEERVAATLRFVEEVLEWTHGHGEEIRAVVAEADSTPLTGDSLALRAVPKRSAERVGILMGEVDEERHPLTGELLLRRRDVSNPEPMYEYGVFEGTDFERVPAGYVVPAELEQVVIRLRAHGVRLETGVPDGTGLEAFRIDSVRTAERPFQGHAEQTVFGVWGSAPTGAPPGALWVPVDQPLGRLVFSLLEPRSDDGFADWGFLADTLEPGAEYPILRAAP